MHESEHTLVRGVCDKFQNKFQAVVDANMDKVRAQLAELANACTQTRST